MSSRKVSEQSSSSKYASQRKFASVGTRWGEERKWTFAVATKCTKLFFSPFSGIPFDPPPVLRAHFTRTHRICSLLRQIVPWWERLRQRLPPRTNFDGRSAMVAVSLLPSRSCKQNILILIKRCVNFTLAYTRYVFLTALLLCNLKSMLESRNPSKRNFQQRWLKWYIWQEAAGSEISASIIGVIHLVGVLIFLNWGRRVWDEEPLEDVTREGEKPFCNPKCKKFMSICQYILGTATDRAADGHGGEGGPAGGRHHKGQAKQPLQMMFCYNKDCKERTLLYCSL